MKIARKDFSGRITPLFDTMMVQPVEEIEVPQDEAEIPQDEAKHKESVPTPSNDPQPSGGRSIEDIDVDVDVSLVDETQKTK
ncbi:hypothetical protein Tco_1419344 [Tanacetum coccineum]